MLVAMGAEIEGIGTDRLVIHGKPRLHGATYRVMPDRIEAGSYACAAAITGGDVELVGANDRRNAGDSTALRDCGVHVEPIARRIRVAADGPLLPLTLSTAPYPGFPTDMQAQFMAMLCLGRWAACSPKRSSRTATCTCPNSTAWARISKRQRPHGDGARRREADRAPVMATDLRASMSLIIAGWRPKARPRSTALSPRSRL
jgi:UDP-N-acetylglucosamine 1-carboxyvinyltransferase